MNIRFIKNSLTLTLLFIAAFLAVVVSLSFLVKKQIDQNTLENENNTVVYDEVIEEAINNIITIGTSVEGRSIESYSFGTGDKDLLFVGGIHGGYEWNSVLLAYEMIDYFSENIATIPGGITIHIIPNANPDGVFDVIGKEGRFTLADIPVDEGVVGNGRFNANDVDLNRNFGCKWQPESMWRGNVVSAGTQAFSEPEAQAIRSYVNLITPAAAIFWHSQANNVYASECEYGVLPETLAIMNEYATAGNYGAVPKFDAYEVTGDAEGWLASIGIPAITVELETHQTIEFDRNLAGVRSLIQFYSK